MLIKHILFYLFNNQLKKRISLSPSKHSHYDKDKKKYNGDHGHADVKPKIAVKQEKSGAVKQEKSEKKHIKREESASPPPPPPPAENGEEDNGDNNHESDKEETSSNHHSKSDQEDNGRYNGSRYHSQRNSLKRDHGQSESEEYIPSKMKKSDKEKDRHTEPDYVPSSNSKDYLPSKKDKYSEPDYLPSNVNVEKASKERIREDHKHSSNKKASAPVYNPSKIKSEDKLPPLSSDYVSYTPSKTYTPSKKSSRKPSPETEGDYTPSKKSSRKPSPEKEEENR